MHLMYSVKSILTIHVEHVGQTCCPTGYNDTYTVLTKMVFFIMYKAAPLPNFIISITLFQKWMLAYQKILVSYTHA